MIAPQVYSLIQFPTRETTSFQVGAPFIPPSMFPHEKAFGWLPGEEMLLGVILVWCLEQRSLVRGLCVGYNNVYFSGDAHLECSEEDCPKSSCFGCQIFSEQLTPTETSSLTRIPRSLCSIYSVLTLEALA